jgi:hypothetical protein
LGKGFGEHLTQRVTSFCRSIGGSKFANPNFANAKSRVWLNQHKKDGKENKGKFMSSLQIQGTLKNGKKAKKSGKVGTKKISKFER